MESRQQQDLGAGPLDPTGPSPILEPPNQALVPVPFYPGVYIAAVGLVGVFAASAINSAVRSEWYEALDKPKHAPKPIVFGTVWSVLYILIAACAVSTVSILASQGKPNQIHFFDCLFALQLALNLLWTLLFFQRRNPKAAFTVILLLWIVVLLMLVFCTHVEGFNLFLVLPYFLWVTYAAYLNWGVLRNGNLADELLFGVID
jgi:benzodiazapine receptor